MRSIVGFLPILFVLFACGARAQEDPMEVQRCIWSCLANSRGADDPDYHACVARQCNGGVPAAGEAGASAPAVSGWTAFGGVSYPKVSQCQGENLCIMVGCPRPGTLDLGLMAYEHGTRPGEIVEFRFRNRTFELALPKEDADTLYRWPMAPDMLNELRRGSRVEVAMDRGSAGAVFRLKGSSAAIDRVTAACY